MNPMALVLELVALAAAGAALDLRAARLIAWFKRQDLLPLGYTSYRAFAAHHVDWSDSWMRACVALVESPLERVKAAVCSGRIPLRIAVRAPWETDLAGEEAWLARVVDRTRRRQAPAPPEVDLSGDVLETIQAAREVARAHLGIDVPEGVADRYILAAWQRGDPAATRREALAPPAPPGPLPPWCDADDPATTLLGRWREPESLADGLEQLGVVNAKRRSRVIDMGVLYRKVLAERAWADDYASVGEMARACDVPLRTLQRAKRLVDLLEALPDTSAALASGEITLDEARKVAAVATADTEEEWLRTLPWYTPPDFGRLVDLAVRGVPVLPLAVQAIDTLIDALAIDDRVAFPELLRQVPPPPHQAVPRDLPEAAAWFLAHFHLDGGLRRVKARDRWRCRNPECRRPTLRLHVHHTRFRSNGGTNDDANLLGLCPACHLRGIHAGHIVVRDDGPVRVWTYPGRRVLELA